MALASVFALMFGLTIGPASAADPSVITVSATPVNYLDGSPAPTAGQDINGSRLAYQVSYGCSVADCDNATVAIAPTQLDPNYDHFRLLDFLSWTAPTSGGTITGDADTGLTVTLGDLPVGASGTFTLVFDWLASGSYKVNERSDVPASNFPENFPLTIDLTATADGAAAPYSVTSAASLWQITTPDPGVVAAPAANIQADTDYSYELRMGTGCMTYIQSQAKGNASYLCAADYTLTHTLPPGAELVSVTNTAGEDVGSLYDRTYDPTTNTITWHAPPWSAEGPTAAGGWHTQNDWPNAKYRIITVRFPAANFAPTGQTCDFSTPASITSDLSVTYIGMPGETGPVRTASDSRTVNVYCVTPFSKAIFDAKTSTYDGNTRESTNVSDVTIPPSGVTNEKHWRTVIGNQANVDGKAVHTDDALDQPGAPVYLISAFTNTSSASTLVPDADAVIEWEATDGTSTQTGTTTGVVNIEELIGTGWHFTKATVTSGSLAAPNTTEAGTARTNSIVDYTYRVSPAAPADELRTNTASGTMTYPGTSLADLDLGSKSHSIRFVEPFARAQLLGKDSTNDGSSGQTRLVNVPGSGSINKQWSVQVSNKANVPGVAVITDDELDQPNTDVYSVTANPVAGASVAYELDNGTTGTASLPYTVPGGRHIVKATVTSGPIAGPNALPSQSANSPFTAYFLYHVASSAPVGEYRTNTASAVMTYPDYPALGSVDLGSASRTIRFSTSKAVFTAQSTPAPVIAGGGSTATPATDVTFSLRGVTSNIYSSVEITPQYVFVAPEGWEITPGSAAFAAGSVPASVTYAYRTVTIGGIQRQAVVASWPNTEAFGKNTTWPTMTVVARPTYAVAAGTTSVATVYTGDSRHTYAGDEATYNGAFQDTPDLDGDGVNTEYFASTTQNVTVGAAGAMLVTKEICFPTPSASDGCTWISDSSTLVGVAPNSTSIEYRLTIRNSGNTTLSNAVGYDVLPYIGDVGTSDATAGSARNSDFPETINAVTAVDSGVDVSFSTSTNPPRPEVYSGTTTGTWGAPASGASAIRMAYPGSIAPGESISLSYTANVVGSPVNGDQACNSFAVAITGIGTVSEPAAVCAAIREADLELTAPDRLPLQEGRTGLVPFTVQNNGGSSAAPAHVALTVPAGVSIRSLTPTGWSCVATPEGASAGPLSLACDPVDGSGLPRQLALDTPETIELPVQPSAGAPAQVCFTGTVSGQMYDPDPANNETEACSSVVPVTHPVLAVDKTDGTDSVAVGDQTTYSLVVTNHLVGELVAGAVLTDTLPAGVTFVSASDGGTASGQTVTWNLAELNPSGAPSGDGSDTTGGSGFTATVTVTVRIDAGTQDTVTNSASVTAPDPAGGDTLTDTARDTDTVLNVFTDLDPAISTPQNQSIDTPLSGIVTTTGAPLDPANVVQETAPGHGSIVIDTETGLVTYLPAPGYSGPDSYRVTVCDTSGPSQCHVSTVTVTVGVNLVGAVDDTDSTPAITAVSTDVRGNDTSESGQPLADPTVNTDPAHGTASVNADGTITYTPVAGFSGTDSYGYQVCDTSVPTPVCDTATVTVLVQNVFTDHGPFTTPQNTALSIPIGDIMSTSGAPLDVPGSIASTEPPMHGAFSVLGGVVTYTPAAGYTGPDSFNVRACDTSTPTPQCHLTIVHVTVGANTVTVPDRQVSTQLNTDAAPVDVLTATTSESGQPLNDPTITDPPGHGTATVNPDGTIGYSPEPGYDGPDEFTYTVCDTGSPQQACATGTVTVTVTPVADLAVSKSLDTATIVAGLPITYTATLHNHGPSAAGDVHSVDPIDARVLNPEGIPDGSVPGGSCLTRATTSADLAWLDPATGPYTIAGYPLVVECTYPSLPAGATVHDTITGTVDAAALPGGAILNQAPAFADTYDPDLSNNLAGVSGEITASADVALTKRAETTTARVGDEVRFTLTVVNHGPSVARDALVTDTPTGMSFVSATTTLGDFDATGRSWTIGTLAVGQTVTATVVQKITATGAQNIAEVSISTADPEPGNNGARDCVSGSDGCGFVALEVDAAATQAGSSASGSLASTGADVARNAVIALLLLLAGAGALLAARRRRN